MICVDALLQAGRHAVPQASKTMKPAKAGAEDESARRANVKDMPDVIA
jgi:hypothetical protein